MQDPSAVSVETKPRYPRSIPFIIGNEAAERFSFYGMRSIMVTFLVAQFYSKMYSPTAADAKGNEIVHLFVALAYTLPFVGGLVADWFTGKYRIILNISIVYCIGHLFLSLFDTQINLFICGLILIAIGAGGIKSCVSANVGDQFDKTNESLISKVYGWFYFSINAGSMFATYLIPTIYSDEGLNWGFIHIQGAKWAFGIPGILMAIATVIFFLGRKKYVRVPPKGIDKNNFVFISVYALFHISKKQKGQSILDVAKGPFNAEKVEGTKAVYRVLAVFIFAPVFWAMWDQNLSEWVLQAAHLNREINLGFTKFTLLPGQVQTVNPIFLLSMIPIFTYWIYPFFNKIGIKATLLRRMGAGLFLTGLSFVVIAHAQSGVDAGLHPSVWWQIFAYVLLSAGEVMVSITGLEYAYTHSPISMKSTMSAIWLLTVAVGNLFDAYVNNSINEGGFFAKYTGASYYWLFVGIISVFLVLFMLISPRLKERNYIDDPDEEPLVIAETQIP